MVWLGLNQAHLASTAVAAPGTLFAEVIITTVLGASYADVRGFLFANATGKGHGSLPVFLFDWRGHWLPGDTLTAALRFLIHQFGFELLDGGQVRQILAQL